jgi:hypothetical protein
VEKLISFCRHGKRTSVGVVGGSWLLFSATVKTDKRRQMAQNTLDKANDAVSIAHEINQPGIANRSAPEQLGAAIQQSWERLS